MHLIGDDGKPTAVNPRARGLDRRVERQEIRLIRDETNRFGKLLDLRRHFTQAPHFGGALLGRRAEIGQLPHRGLGRLPHPVGGFFHLRARLARPVAGCRELGGAVLQLARFKGGGADQRCRLARAVTRALGRRGDFLAGRVNLLRRGGQCLHVLRRLIGRAGHRTQRTIDRHHERELRREQLQELAIRLTVHGGIRVPDAPETDELTRVVERDEHFRARRLAARHYDLISRESMRHEGAAQPQRFTSEAGVGIESERGGTRLRCRVGDQLHLTRAGIIASKSHLFPGDEPAHQLLHALEAVTQRELCGDHLGEPLNQMQLVGPHAQTQHTETAPGRERQRADEQRARTARKRCVHHREPAQCQGGGHEVDDRFPPQREPGVHPRDRLTEGELQIERAVHDHGQHDDRERDHPGVVGGQCRNSGRSAQAGVHESHERGSCRQMRRVPQRRAEREAAQQYVTDQHREWRDDRGERPAMVEDPEQHDTEDV